MLSNYRPSEDHFCEVLPGEAGSHKAEDSNVGLVVALTLRGVVPFDVRVLLTVTTYRVVEIHRANQLDFRVQASSW